MCTKYIVCIVYAIRTFVSQQGSSDDRAMSTSSDDTPTIPHYQRSINDIHYNEPNQNNNNNHNNQIQSQTNKLLTSTNTNTNHTVDTNLTITEPNTDSRSSTSTSATVITAVPIDDMTGK